MAETESELRQQELERDSLQRTVSGLQGAMMYASGEHRAVLETALRNASSHLATVEKKVKDLTSARETEGKEATTRAVLMAQQERRLNAQEKETFAGFMKKDFFTKADFGRLDEFYKKSYDRLSEHGKDEMSQRFWEGIRRGEYRFEDAPSKIRETEAARLHERLKAGTTVWPGHGPDADREAFLRAMDGRRNVDAEAILNRVITAPAAAVGSDVAAILAKTAKNDEYSKTDPKTKSTPDLSDINLDGIQLADATGTQKSAEMPNGKLIRGAKGRVSPGS